MRLRAIAYVTALLLATVTGCSSTSESEPPPAGPANAQGAFPANVDTKFGTVEIAEQPQRVVALGWGDAETALALGVQPVGASDWLAFGGEGVGPWAAGQYDNPPQIISTMEPSLEQIAALEPDLILDVKGSGEQQRHDQLDQIAPTIGVPAGADNYLTSTQDQTMTIATALGQPEKGKQLLGQIDAAFDKAAAEHPQWKGKTATAAARTSEGWGAYVETSERVQFLERLGFVQNPTIAAMAPDAGGFTVAVSTEQLHLLDADAIIAFPIYLPATEISDNPLYQAIPAVKQGHSVVVDDDLSAAWSLGSPPSTLYAIEKLVPKIEERIN